ncbi:MAG: bifunctional aspartate kinase/homoserine dehydrogenase I [Acidimicrobiia bacterium]
MTSTWVTYKFGGSSLADSDGYRRVASLIAEAPAQRRAVVVSAMAGVTDTLIGLVARAAERDRNLEESIAGLQRQHGEVIEDLVDPDIAARLISQIAADCKNIADVLRATSLMGVVSDHAVGTVSGYGELWSARLLASYLTTLETPAAWLDAREVLVVQPAEMAPLVDWERARSNLTRWLEASTADSVVITGFIASDHNGAPTTLGRNGSDYSATIFASLLGASEVVIWTDVDGVMSADPRLVPQAHVLEHLSYNEAMELAYFGAEVIHPATLTPAVEIGIPVTIRNTFNPNSPGTRITSESIRDRPVKGLASIGDIALVNLEGTAMIGVPGISERVFSALRDRGVSVVMISQGSSEHSICFAVPETQADEAKAAVARAFAPEIHHGLIQEPEVTPDCTILAIVGDGMSGTPGIAARFFTSLARAGVNVRSIAQGASERNISIVIDSADAARALRAAHSGFYLSRHTLSIGLIGPGHVGATLLDQMATQIGRLVDEFGVDLRVRAIATSKRMATDEHRIDLESWREALEASSTAPTDLEALVSYVHTDTVPHAAIIDCTASDEVALNYRDWLAQGIHVITPNKKANTGPIDYYRALKEISRRADAHYFYETTVGAALPVIQTLRDLVQTGDRIYRIEGVFSGTLSYLFNNFDGSKPFSAIVGAAREQGYTEPDPREDLSGMDVARKVVILAREMGMEVELEDLEIEGLVPEELAGGSVDEFLTNLEGHDEEMVDLLQVARERGEVLRFVGVIDPTEGCRVSLRAYREDHPFARIQATDNIVTFRTARYHDNPLVVQGPGAGPEVTAGGVFADLLRLANYLGATL